MITDSDMEKAVDFLRSEAGNAAKAKAEKEYLDSYSKVIKAQIQRENTLEGIGAQEARAYADQRYATHLNGLKVAIEQDEFYRWKRAAAEALIEAWRSQQANERALGKVV